MLFRDIVISESNFTSISASNSSETNDNSEEICKGNGWNVFVIISVLS